MSIGHRNERGIGVSRIWMSRKTGVPALEQITCEQYEAQYKEEEVLSHILPTRENTCDRDRMRGAILFTFQSLKSPDSLLD